MAEVADGFYGTKEEKDILQQAHDRWDELQEAEKTNREEALDDLKFLAGEQWPDDIAKVRKQNRRPCLTINISTQFVRQVTGDIRQNKPSIKVLPVENADKGLASIFTGLIRHVEQSSNASAAYINAAEGAASCGMGWFRISTEFSTDDGFEQDIKIKRGKNHFAAWFDPSAQELDKSDGRYAFVTELIPIEDFKARFPKAKTQDFEDKGPNNQSQKYTDWWDGEFVRVAEYWVKKPESKELALLEDGTTKDVSGMKAEEIIALKPKRRRIVASHKVCSYLMNGCEILEGPMEWAGKYIPIIFVVGEEVNLGDTVMRHGLIRFAKDPQRMLNFMRSASAEAIALQPKAPWVVTKDEINGYEDQWNNAHIENRPYLLFNPSGGDRPQRVEPPKPPTALWAEGENAVQDMYATTGIYPASLGAKSNETSGKAILARQRESDTGTFAYVDNLASAIAYCGRQLVDLIPKIYDTERQVRVLGEDDSHEFVTINQTVRTPDGDKLLNDLSAGKYDVVVTTGPSYATKRVEAAESMMAFLQSIPNAGPIIGDLVAKNMDWPGADQIADRLKQAAGIPDEGEDGQPAGPPPPPDPMQMLAAQTEQTKLEAEMASALAQKAEAEMKLAAVQPMGGDPNAMAGQIAEILRAELAAQNDGQAMAMRELGVGLQAVLTYIAAPKVIVRNAQGVPVAVQTVMNGATDPAQALATLNQPRQIALDQAGRPVGVH